MKPSLVNGLLMLTVGPFASGQSNRIDLVRPDAPELAAHGEYSIGVRTMEVVNPNQLDIVNAEEGKDAPRYDRRLTLEVWYPANLGGADRGGEYRAMTRDGHLEVSLKGIAVRDGEVNLEGAPFPLVILSHGYPGNRYLLSHLGENLATKGYVAISIDHRDSTYDDMQAFGSTLLNRSLDQLFVLNEIAKESTEASGSWLEGLVDADRTAIIGYSMGRNHRMRGRSQRGGTFVPSRANASTERKSLISWADAS